MKKIITFFFIFVFLSAFSPMSYNKIKEIAKETNIKLFGKYQKQSINIKNAVPHIVANTNISIKKPQNKTNVKKNSKTTIKIVKSSAIQSPTIQNADKIFIITKKRRNKLKIFKLPYLNFNKVVSKIIGTPNDMENSLCQATLLNKEVIEPCNDVKKFINERNRLLDEFARNLLKFKTDILKNNAYYENYFNCGLLYKYYSYKHYADCDKLMNTLSNKEKQQLYDYVNFVLKN